MILYTLSLSSHGFVFLVFSPKMSHTNWMCFPIPNRCVWEHALHEHRFSRGFTTSFCLDSIHIIKLEPDFDTIYQENSWTFPIHISMIMSILGLNFHGFVFLAFLLKCLILIRCYPYLYTQVFLFLIDMIHCESLDEHPTIFKNSFLFLKTTKR